MMATLDTRTRIDAAPGGREEVLPSELSVGLRVFPGQRMRQRDPAGPLGEVALVQDRHPVDLAPQVVVQGGR